MYFPKICDIYKGIKNKAHFQASLLSLEKKNLKKKNLIKGQQKIKNQLNANSLLNE